MMMELEDAIKHAEEKSGSCECGKEHAQLAKWLKELAALRASPSSVPEDFNHSIGVDRFTTVRGTYWWHVRAGDGTQNIGKFHTKLAAEDMALALLTAFRDGAFMYYQTTLAAAPTPPSTEDRQCKCTLAQSLVGDGCDVCNPKLAAELREEQAAEDRKDADLWRDLVSHQKFNNVPAVGYAINQAKKRQAMREDKP